MAIERYESNEFELYINTETGEVFSSQNGLIRMLRDKDPNVKKTTVLDFVSSRKLEVNYVKAPTNRGMQRVRVYTEDDMHEVFEYFKSPLLKQCTKCGLRVYLHRLAGFQVTSTAIQKPELNTTQDLLLKILAKQEEQGEQIRVLNEVMQTQNSQINLMLPDYQTMQDMREAVELLPNLKLLLKEVSKVIKSKSNHTYYRLSKFMTGKHCSRGERVQVGQLVSHWLSVSLGEKLPKLNGNKDRVTLYPECTSPLFDFALKLVRKS